MTDDEIDAYVMALIHRLLNEVRVHELYRAVEDGRRCSTHQACHAIWRLVAVGKLQLNERWHLALPDA